MAKAGRPKGSNNKDYDQVDAPPPPTPTACKRCGSTEREPYFGRTEQSIQSLVGGHQYAKIVWRRTKCSACGQHRIDRSLE